jgi:hypothetical protein
VGTGHGHPSNWLQKQRVREGGQAADSGAAGAWPHVNSGRCAAVRPRKSFMLPSLEACTCSPVGVDRKQTWPQPTQADLHCGTCAAHVYLRAPCTVNAPTSTCTTRVQCYSAVQCV